MFIFSVYVATDLFFAGQKLLFVYNMEIDKKVSLSSSMEVGFIIISM